MAKIYCFLLLITCEIIQKAYNQYDLIYGLICYIPTRSLKRYVGKLEKQLCTICNSNLLYNVYYKYHIT